MNYDLIYKYDVFYIVEHFLQGEKIQTPVGIKSRLAMNCSVTFYRRCSLISDMQLQFCWSNSLGPHTGGPGGEENPDPVCHQI